MTKICTKCKEDKPLGEFRKNQSNKGGLSSSCKLCDRERDRRYREKNQENNREKARERNRKYREKNRDYKVAKHREDRRKKAEISASMATKSGRWSQEEVDLLVELRKTRTVYQCAIELGRKYGSTHGKISYLRRKGVEV